jgi:hypothetical protein
MNVVYRTVYCLLIIAAFAGNVSATENREWSFRVLLDGKDVGNQHFVVTNEDGRTRLETQADFKVKFLFATVYRYMHQNVETWEGDCLTEIQSTTDMNGIPYSVNGQQRDGFFEVVGDGQAEMLPECVMSFAYWNPSFLEHGKLLNSQNGEYLDVEISSPEPDFRTIRGKKVPALKYRLSARELDLQLWYSTDNQWIALESKTKGNRVLSYELL